MREYDPKKQFSKWLAKSGAIYWIAFLSAILFVMVIRPEVATACVYLAIIVSVVMIFHVWAYTKNSTYEKGVLALLDKTRMELGLKLGNTTNNGRNDDVESENGDVETDDDGDPPPEEVSNG